MRDEGILVFWTAVFLISENRVLGKGLREKDGQSIYNNLEACLERHVARKQDPVLIERVTRLARWQSHRLAVTYTDLLQTERYSFAMEFFRTDMYGPRDYSQRDSDVKRIYPIMSRVMPLRLLHTLTYVAEVNAVSMKLDEDLVAELVAMGTIENIMPDVYAEAYRRCDNYQVRRHQIDLVMDIGKDLDELVRKPYIGGLLKVAHKPAHMMGLGTLQDFLERGFSAFLHMNGAQEFLACIKDRELRILDKIFEGSDDPFNIECAPVTEFT